MRKLCPPSVFLDSPNDEYFCKTFLNLCPYLYNNPSQNIAFNQPESGIIIMSIAIQIEYAAQIWTTFMYFNVTNIELNKMANKHFFVTDL